jgi:flagellar hook-length control protein FliK
MKSFVQTIKLSEPIKPADKSKQVDNHQQTNKQNNEGTEQRNSFQAMLNRQVQDKQLENQRIQLKQLQAKSTSKADDVTLQKPIADASSAKVDVGVEMQALAKDQVEPAQRQIIMNANNNKATVLTAKEPDANPQAMNTLETPVETAHHSTIVDGNSTALNDKQRDSSIAQQQMDDAANINAQIQAIMINQPVNSTSKVLTNPVSEENSKATIDVMVDQKLASDLRQKSMNKTDLNEDKLDKTDDETSELSEKEAGMKEAFQDKLNQMQIRSDKGSPLGQTVNQVVSNQQFKERVGHYEAMKSMLPNDGAIRGDVNTNSQGIMNLQANMQQNLMPTNSTMMAPQAGGAQFIAQSFGKPGWSEAINQRVMYMVNASEQTATLTLNPPDLGPLQVVISVNNDKADTTFISDNADVRQALQDGMDNLREKMNEAGISLGQSNVNSGAQQQANQANPEKSGPQGSQNLGNPIPQPIDKAPTKVIFNNGLVDLFA